jgi:chemotaxis family two-component system response regulator Rcp1
MNFSEEQPVKILLVEDNPADARLVREVFAETGVAHQLCLVPDGESALDFLRGRGDYRYESQPGLVLLDIGLPGKNGMEVLAEIKADASMRHIPVVVMSASRLEDDIVKMYELHASAYVVKSGDLDHFVEVVRSIENFWLETARLPHVHSSRSRVI